VTASYQKHANKMVEAASCQNLSVCGGILVSPLHCMLRKHSIEIGLAAASFHERRILSIN